VIGSGTFSSVKVRAYPAAWANSESERRVLGVLFVATSILFAIGMATFLIAMWAATWWHGVVAVVAACLGGALFGAAMTSFVAAVWRRQGGVRTSQLMQRAVKTRELPAGIDETEWARLLARQEAAAVRGRWTYPLFFGVSTVFYLYLGLTEAMPRLWLLPWVGALFFGGVGVYAPFDTERRLRGIRALRAALASGAEAGQPESRRD
jgi:hypothetical protein